MPIKIFVSRAVFLLSLILPLPVMSGVTSEMLVSDRHSGLALFGFDPVSYYVDKAALAGSSSHEVTFAGFTWRFRSEANRAAFIAQPGSYIPKFGGYDVLAVVRGAPVAGHPAVFLVYRDDLYLFTNEQNREEFLRRPEPLLQAARTAWPEVRKTLVP